MKTVLAPIDFSSVSRQVVDEAIAIARRLDARLVLLHVVQLPAVLGTGVTENDLPASFRLQVESDAVRQLGGLQRQLRDEGVTAHVIHQVGSPGERILEQADRLDADYIVMGSHGHGAFYDLIAGSTTSRVVTRAKCPVMIIPLKNRPTRSGQLHLGRYETVGA
jgi:nucleotide-binding universal stress UspA family protein